MSRTTIPPNPLIPAQFLSQSCTPLNPSLARKRVGGRGQREDGQAQGLGRPGAGNKRRNLGLEVLLLQPFPQSAIRPAIPHCGCRTGRRTAEITPVRSGPAQTLQWRRPPENRLQGLPEGTGGQDDGGRQEDGWGSARKRLQIFHTY